MTQNSKLQVGKVANIRYTKGSEISERVVIPTTVPTNVKALDVSDLSENEVQTMESAYQEYASYLKNHMKRAASFEEFLDTRYSHTFPKWRTFKPENVEIL